MKRKNDAEKRYILKQIYKDKDNRRKELENGELELVYSKLKEKSRED